MFGYIHEAQAASVLTFSGCRPAGAPRVVEMTDAQFVRFKNAGRQHPSAAVKLAGTISRDRADRQIATELEKWDVGHYGKLTGRSGPWGAGAATNRDHMTANSSNQKRQQTGNYPGGFTTVAEVKQDGLSITVSGDHHRAASYTYGGRTAKTDAPGGKRRMDFGAEDPTASFKVETEAMLQWKSSHIGSGGTSKNTLRLEMVGAYAFMYKRSVALHHITPTMGHDEMLISYIEAAVANDDATGQVVRK